MKLTKVLDKTKKTLEIEVKLEKQNAKIYLVVVSQFGTHRHLCDGVSYEIPKQNAQRFVGRIYDRFKMFCSMYDQRPDLAHRYLKDTVNQYK